MYRKEVHLHSPLENKTLDGFIFHPPYLFTAVTFGGFGRYRLLKTVSHCFCWSASWKNDVSIKTGLLGSAT